MSVFGTLGIAYRARLCLIGDDLILGIRQKRVHLVIIASDCGPSSLKKINDKSSSFAAKTIVYGTKSNLAAAIGKKEISAIGISDSKLANKIFEEIIVEKSKEDD